MDKCYHYPINKEHNGQCCCNCVHQIVLKKHPWNKSDIFRGSISKQVTDQEDTPIFVCTALGEAIAFDSKHGMCELHDFKTIGEAL